MLKVTVRKQSISRDCKRYMNKPDHYSLLTVVLSFTLGALSTLNAVAETYLPLISAVSMVISISLTIWYYRTKINEIKKSPTEKGPTDG